MYCLCSSSIHCLSSSSSCCLHALSSWTSCLWVSLFCCWCLRWLSNRYSSLSLGWPWGCIGTPDWLASCCSSVSLGRLQGRVGTSTASGLESGCFWQWPRWCVVLMAFGLTCWTGCWFCVKAPLWCSLLISWSKYSVLIIKELDMIAKRFRWVDRMPIKADNSGKSQNLGPGAVGTGVTLIRAEVRWQNLGHSHLSNNNASGS